MVCFFPDLFTSNTYTYPMKKRSLLSNKITIIYKEIFKKKERNIDKVMRIHTDREFEQNEIKRPIKSITFRCLVGKPLKAKLFQGTKNKRILKTAA